MQQRNYNLYVCLSVFWYLSTFPSPLIKERGKPLRMLKRFMECDRNTKGGKLWKILRKRWKTWECGGTHCDIMTRDLWRVLKKLRETLENHNKSMEMPRDLWRVLEKQREALEMARKQWKTRECGGNATRPMESVGKAEGSFGKSREIDGHAKRPVESVGKAEGNFGKCCCERDRKETLGKRWKKQWKCQKMPRNLRKVLETRRETLEKAVETPENTKKPTESVGKAEGNFGKSSNGNTGESG